MNNLIQIDTKGGRCYGIKKDKGINILVGSCASKVMVHSCKDHHRKKQKELISDGYVKEDDNKLVFIKEFYFPTMGLAESVLKGSSRDGNGWNVERDGGYEYTTLPWFNSTFLAKKPLRKRYQNNSIIRDKGIPLLVKDMYEYKCQMCGIRLEADDFWYAEAAHIKPLGEPHNGNDTLDNILCLCPNHHKLFDIAGLYIQDDLYIPTLERSLNVNKDHDINLEFVKYHRQWCQAANKKINKD